MRGDAVVPTDPVNVWYAQGSILVEAGGRLMNDADRWGRLLTHLRPSRFAAAIGRGRQASRIAIVCFGVDELLQAGASQNLASHARAIRERLSEASRYLGVRLPVYVLFTRTDRVPYFADFVRNFTTQEAQQVIGATLPVTSDAGGSWAEQESKRLNETFGRLIHSLSLRRIDVLQREQQENLRANAYEFPRELRKAAEPAVQFLIDVFRPNQLGVNPLLRGVYFTGVRPVLVRDSGAGDALAQGGGGLRNDAGATSVFSPAAARQAPQPVARGGERKLPQWVFLPRLFSEIILRDELASRITGGGARVDILRRILIGSVAAACLVFAFGLTFSWANNSALLRDSRNAVQAAREVGAVPGAPVEESLLKLDELRLQTEKVAQWKTSGRPLSYAWGLYTGDKVEPILTSLYFDRFENMLWRDTREKMNSYLQGLPDTPDENSDFGKAQDALAAHLITSSEHRRSTSEVLTPALLGFWATGETSDTSRARAARQFEYYANALQRSNPYDLQPDAALVTKTQGFLRKFGPQAYYRVLIATANSSAPSKQYSGPRDYVRNDYVVPGAFTLDGYKQVNARIDNVDALFARYEWVYGAPPEKPERAALVRMYENEYVSRWHTYLESGSVADFASPTDGATKLRMLGELNSPIVNMLAVASRETDMDSTSRIGKAFKPLRVTVPANDPRGPGANLVEYLGQLGMLSTQLGMLEGATPDAMATAANFARGIGVKESGVAASMISTDEGSRTAGLIQRILTQPGARALSLVTELPKAEMNADARAFCETFRPLAGMYPFAANGRDAPSRAVTAVFQRGEGSLWSLYSKRLEPYFNTLGLERTRGRTNQDFAKFFLRAAEFSNSLYTDKGDGPLISFFFRPYSYPAGANEIVLEVNGSAYTFRQNANNFQPVGWRPDATRPTRLTARSGGNVVFTAEAEGEWSIFRIFAGTTWREAGNNQRVVWKVPNRPDSLVADVLLDTKPVLKPGYLGDLAACPPRILN